MYFYSFSLFCKKQTKKKTSDLFWLQFWPSYYHFSLRIPDVAQTPCFLFLALPSIAWCTSMIIPRSWYSNACTLSLTHYLPGLCSLPQARWFSLSHAMKSSSLQMLWYYTLDSSKHTSFGGYFWPSHPFATRPPFVIFLWWNWYITEAERRRGKDTSLRVKENWFISWLPHFLVAGTLDSLLNFLQL